MALQAGFERRVCSFNLVAIHRTVGSCLSSFWHWAVWRSWLSFAGQWLT